MVTFRELSNALRKLEIDGGKPVIAHASLSAFGGVHGGADGLLGALLMQFSALVMPTFTYKTMVIPEVGPPDNALAYGSGTDLNKMAEFFTPEMPADTLMGAAAEALRRHPKARRSAHPILSFAGVDADSALQSQTRQEPLAPVRALTELGGWVLLLGVDHTVDTSIHYAEKLAGRKQFLRWALTPQGIEECPGFPGCSDGFQALAPFVEDAVHRAWAGPALIEALPLKELVAKAQDVLRQDPKALLCARPDCPRCNAVRWAVDHE